MSRVRLKSKRVIRGCHWPGKVSFGGIHGHGIFLLWRLDGAMARTQHIEHLQSCNRLVATHNRYTP